ncbi:MAG: hypothetical protein HKL99_14170 [Burkholderiales bacterium]|nr:hypothetical protein [Burkholderiales bacterium]
MSEKGAKNYVKGNKIGFVVLVVVAILIGVMYWMAKARMQTGASSLAAAPKITSVAGQGGTPRYNGDVTAENAAAAAAASAAGRSSLPTPVGVASNPYAGASMKPDFAAPGANSPTHAAPVTVAMPQVAMPAPPQSVQPIAMAQAPSAYAQEVKNVLGAIVPVAQGDVSIATQNASSGAPGAAVVAAESSGSGARRSTLPPAGAHLGSKIFGVFVTAANSDSPGPVLMRVPDGVGALGGATFVGAFERHEDALEVKLTSMRWDNADWHVDAVVINPNTQLPAMSTDVDTHWLERYGSLLGGAFLSGLQGFGQAVAQSGQTTLQSTGTTTTVTTNPSLSTHQELVIAGATAAGNAAQTIGQSIQQNWSRAPTVSIASGTGAGILFLSTPQPDGQVVAASGGSSTGGGAAAGASAQAPHFMPVKPIQVGAPLSALGLGSQGQP